MAESEEELKSLLMKVKEERGKVGLKLNIQKTKIMASAPITSWQTDGETMKTVSDFIFWAPRSLQMGTAAMTLIQNLEIKMESQINSLEARIEKMQERFNKDLEEIKKSQYIMNNAISEINSS